MKSKLLIAGAAIYLSGFFLIGCSHPSSTPSPPERIIQTAQPQPSAPESPVAHPVSVANVTSSPSQPAYVPYEDDATRRLKAEAFDADRQRKLNYDKFRDLKSRRGSDPGSGSSEAITATVEFETKRDQAWFDLGCYLIENNRDREQGLDYLKKAARNESDWPINKKAKEKLKALGLMPNNLESRQDQSHVQPCSASSASVVSSRQRTHPDELLSWLSKADRQYAKFHDSSFEDLKANHATAKSEAVRRDYKASIKYLELNIQLLKACENRAIQSVGASLSSVDLDEATSGANELRRVKLLQSETQLSLGLLYQSAGSEAEARKYLNLASAPKGLTDEWDGKSEWIGVQQCAAKTLAHL